MSKGIEGIAKVIDMIEEQLTGEIDYAALAEELTLSLYEFRRIFSFVVGCPLSEYVRRRRLTLAASEIVSSKEVSIQQISEKYGYSTEAAFSRAFKEQHGVAPSALRESDAGIRLFTKPRFELSVSNQGAFEMTLSADGEYKVSGLSMNSPITDSCCCDAVWERFYEESFDSRLTKEKIYAVYRESGNEVLCTIGERESQGDGETVGGGLWACFKLNTVDDGEVNKRYSEILYDLLPSAGFLRDKSLPTVEVFPSDMSYDGFEWEIRIPVIPKK